MSFFPLLLYERLHTQIWINADLTRKVQIWLLTLLVS